MAAVAVTAVGAMTERLPKRRRGPRPRVVMLGTVATFLAVLALLSFQLRAGLDPALGAGRQAVALVASVHGKKVVTRASGGSAGTAPSTRTGAAHHGRHAHVTTRASGAGSHRRGGGEND